MHHASNKGRFYSLELNRKTLPIDVPIGLVTRKLKHRRLAELSPLSRFHRCTQISRRGRARVQRPTRQLRISLENIVGNTDDAEELEEVWCCLPRMYTNSDIAHPAISSIHKDWISRRTLGPHGGSKRSR